MRGLKRVLAVSALLMGGVTGWASGARAVPCAEWLSSGGGGEPMVGHLTGTSTITVEWTLSVAGITYHLKEEFEVGTYDFGNGERMRIDCRTYQLWP